MPKFLQILHKWQLNRLFFMLILQPIILFILTFQLNKIRFILILLILKVLSILLLFILLFLVLLVYLGLDVVLLWGLCLLLGGFLGLYLMRRFYQWYYEFLYLLWQLWHLLYEELAYSAVPYVHYCWVLWSMIQIVREIYVFRFFLYKVENNDDLILLKKEFLKHLQIPNNTLIISL